jgi:hypothetical protein
MNKRSSPPPGEMTVCAQMGELQKAIQLTIRKPANDNDKKVFDAEVMVRPS